MKNVKYDNVKYQCCLFLFQMYENEQLKYQCLVAAKHDHHKEQAEKKGGVNASHI